MLRNISRLFIIATLLLSTKVSVSQTPSIPDGILFQAVATDAKGNPASNRTIYVKDAIIEGSANGSVVYSETFVVKANAEGVFTIVIGKGQRLSGPSSIKDLDMSDGPYYLNLKAAVSPSIPLSNWNPETQYVDMGTSQFWTVPFALYASKVSGFDLKMNLSDTSAMLKTYMRYADTASLSRRIDATSLQTGLNDTSRAIRTAMDDTSSSLRTALAKAESDVRSTLLDTASDLRSYADLKLNITDTATMLSNRIAKDTVSLSNRINQKLSGSDTLSLSGRINDKLSISDTSTMLSDRFARDTVSLSNRINQKLTGSDTLSLSSRINDKLSLSDTSTMLSNRFSRDTASLSSRIDLKFTSSDTIRFVRKATSEVSIGLNAAGTTGFQGPQSVAIGQEAGASSQGPVSVAIGAQAGKSNQGPYTVAIGYQAGNNIQGPITVALGYKAGRSLQGPNGVAIGNRAGDSVQSVSAIAIGTEAGKKGQGQYAIALGAYSGLNDQSSNSIILNASGSTLDGSNQGFFVAPIRELTSPKSLLYDPTTKEITYSTLTELTVGTVSSTSSINGASVVSNTLYLSPADASNPGIISTSTQTFAGAKSFGSDLKVKGITLGVGAGDELNAEYNTAIGLDALVNNTGWGNTAVGRETLTKSQNSTNTAVGYTALKNNVNGNSNVAVGSRALPDNTDGNVNTAIGANSLISNTEGSNNTAIGNMAMFNNIKGSQNTAIGSESNVESDNLTNATAIGYGAITNASNTIQLGNTNVDSVVTSGKLKLGSIVYPNTDSTSGLFLTTDGSGNLSWATASPLVGTVSATTTQTNIFDLVNDMTSYADMNIFSANNLLIGNDALKNLTTGIANIAMGDSAMLNTSDAGANVAIGYKSMYKNTSGNANTAVGSYSLFENTTGRYNNAFGNLALASNTTGIANSAFGEWALRLNTTGSRNTATGTNALNKNTTGNYNTANGRAALLNNSIGEYNTAVGFQALAANTEGMYNTAIGVQADVASGTISNSTAIGYGAIANESNIIRLGNSNISSVITSGNIKLGDVVFPNVHNSTSGQVLTIDGSGTATWSTTTASPVELTGDVTGSGTGTFTTTIADGAVTTTKIYSADVTPGYVLTATVSGTTVWEALPSSSITMGSIGTATSTGASISSGVLSLSPADATNPGIVSTLSQTFAGEKSFSSFITSPSIKLSNGSSSENQPSNWILGTAVGSTALALHQVGCCVRFNIDEDGKVAIGANYAPSLYQFDVEGNGRFTQDLNVNGLTIGKGNGNVGSNTVLGSSALLANISGAYNTAVGESALTSVSTGSYNTAIGYGSDVLSSTLSNTTAIGYNAKPRASNTIQLGNSSIDSVVTSGIVKAAGFKTISGTSSEFLKADGSKDPTRYVDRDASMIGIGFNAHDFEPAYASIAIGDGAGMLYQGYEAVAIGFQAGQYYQGNNSIAIGSYAGDDGFLNSQSANSIILNATGNSLNASDQGFYVAPIRFQSSYSNNPLVYDPITKEIQYSNGFAYNEIRSNSILTGNLAITSDRRLKSEIKTLASTLDIIKKLNPVSYKKKDSISSINYKHEEMGFIAQEIQKVLPMLVLEGTDNDKTLSVNYMSLIPVLTKAIQEQQNQIEEKAKVTDELKKQLDRQQKEIDELRELIKSIKK